MPFFSQPFMEEIRLFGQKYLLTVTGGYIGCLVISLLVMLVSAKTKSAVFASILPFIIIFVPSIIGSLQSPFINKILGLLPDRLLQVNSALNFFELYRVGGKITGAVPLLFIVYGVFTVVLLPMIYQVYRKKQIV